MSTVRINKRTTFSSVSLSTANKLASVVKEDVVEKELIIEEITISPVNQLKTKKKIMKETTKNTLAAVIICAAILLSGWILSTGAFIGYLLLPVVTYSAGTTLGKLKNDKWNWKDGLIWGVIGIVASVLFSLAV